MECRRRARKGQLDISMDLDPLRSVVRGDAALCLEAIAKTLTPGAAETFLEVAMTAA